MTDFTLHLGDSREVLKTFAENSVDSVCCDPPYELGFMGKGWDSTGVANDPALWAEVLRVLKPGGHLLAFSGTRTYHRMVCAIEDAGFDIRDQIGWLYGSGFPKSHNGEWGGTALKPAWEPIVMARKPLVGTVEANWLAYGTGALNINDCRIEGESTLRDKAAGAGQFPHEDDAWEPKAVTVGSDVGRWPANIIHDGSDEVVAAFPYTSSGTGAVKRASSADDEGNTGAAFGAESRPAGTPMVCHGDEGSAARFFYCAKTSKEDRDDGLAAFAGQAREARYGSLQDGRPHTPEGYEYHREPRKNIHPTVKPTDLMRYLCRLVTPKGGLVLDPFMGSGSTGKAAMLENFSFVGIDMTSEYVEIARARIDFARRQGYQPDLLESA